MTSKPDTQLDVSPEEEDFLRITFRRHARSYLAVSVFALGFAAAGLGFGLRNASAGDVDTHSLRKIHTAQRAQIEALKLEIATQLEGAHRRIRSLEEKQGITSVPASPGLYKRLNALEARLSVIELERG